ncbi:MAG TPA: hypothetical protein VK598_05300 [Nitrospiraceae bacterium]|nr:hypothetical protein [Nitrospiraceae bacterium]
MKMDPYSTYLPVLPAIAAQADGPILEIGGGLYSTPCLHGLGKPLVTDREVFARLAFLQTENHRILCADSYENS